MMQRTQISLQTELHRRARERATQLGVSLAEYIRQIIAKDLEAPTGTGDVEAVFGLFDSGGSDIAADKDAYLGEAVATARVERR